MKEFALFLSSINDYEEAIEEFEKHGYEIDHEWNDYLLNKIGVTWNYDAYLTFSKKIQLHSHNCDYPVFIELKDINLEQFNKP